MNGICGTLRKSKHWVGILGKSANLRDRAGNVDFLKKVTGVGNAGRRKKSGGGIFLSDERVWLCNNTLSHGPGAAPSSNLK